MGAGLCILGQAEFAANEECHLLEKESSSKIGHIEGMLTSRGRKRMGSKWKDSEPPAKWIEQTQQTIKSHAQTQQWECACILIQ